MPSATPDQGTRATTPSTLEEIRARALPQLARGTLLYDAGEGLAVAAAAKLRDLGYGDVALLEGGLDGWRGAGAELFRDVNVPSKAFGEFVEATCGRLTLAGKA